MDAEGNPTANPTRVLNRAIILSGGYKGSTIAMMVELVADPLIGEHLSFEAAAEDNGDGGPSCGGELIITKSPEYLGGQAVEHARRLFAKLAKEPAVRLPSSRRYANRALSARDGIEVSADLFATLGVA